MGNDIEPGNEDIQFQGEENIYTFGNGMDNPDSNNFSVINSIFNKSLDEKYFTIKLTDSNANYFNPSDFFFNYKYADFTFQGENKSEIKSKWNSFNFPIGNIGTDFANTLFFHFYEKDVKNSRNNVIVCFLPSEGYNSQENMILESIDRLKSISYESLPIVIFIGGKKIEYSDKLKNINYLPGFDQTYEEIEKKSEGRLSRDEIKKLTKEAQINYLRSKFARIDFYYNQRGYNLNFINPLQMETQTISINLTVGVVGNSGTGKSTFINLNFDELVARVSLSSVDVTIKCSEYLLPPKETSKNNKKIGQIRFIDFPGIKEERNYYDIVKPELLKKIKEFEKNQEQIDVALFFIPNGNEREISDAGIDLIKILHKYKIKIIFVINGDLSENRFTLKKQSIRNVINDRVDRNLIPDDSSNIIHTNFTMDENEVNRNMGIKQIWEKILSYIKVPNAIYADVEKNINKINCEEKFQTLRKNSRIFEKFLSIDYLKKWAKIKANWTITGFSFLACGSSIVAMFVPFVDAVITVGYEVGMLYSILSIYELNPDDYDKVSIIVSTGDKINRMDGIKPSCKLAGDISADVAETVVGIGCFTGKEIVQKEATKEVGKLIAVKTVETTVVENTAVAVAKVGLFSGIDVAAQATTNTIVSKTVEEIAMKAGKEATELALKQGAQQVSKEIAEETIKALAIEVSEEGVDALIINGSKTTIKTVTEEVVIKQGGKAWLVNLGKAVPFIGAGISAIMNTFTIGKLGYKLVKKFDEEFMDKTPDFIKGKLYAVSNICEQIELLI